MEEPAPRKSDEQRRPDDRFSSGSVTAAVSIGILLVIAYFAFALVYGVQVWSPETLAAGIVITVFLLFLLFSALRTRRAGRELDRQVIDLEARLQGLGDRFSILSAETQSRESVARELISSLSHDMRTSLNALSGWAKILEREGLSQNLRSSAIEGISRSIERQSALLDEAEEFLALEEDDSVVLEDRVRCEELLSEVIRSVSPNAESRHVELEVTNSIDTPVRCDRAKLRKALDKIVRTVVRVTPVGGKLAIATAHGPDGLRISIRNSGEMDSRRFPFQRIPGVSTGDSEPAGAAAGSGLALATSRRIIEMHGGEVSVNEDIAGLGTEIDVNLPE